MENTNAAYTVNKTVPIVFTSMVYMQQPCYSIKDTTAFYNY